jgi:folate-binding protein YgfZ
MQLPVHDQHVQAGARLLERFGWEVPRDYGDPLAEALAARQVAGLADRSDRGKIRLTGPERVPFLHALVTNDLTALSPERGCYTLALNHKGQIVAEFPVLPWGESLLLTVEPGERAFTLSWLQRHKLRRKVEIQDVTTELALFSLVGPQAPAVLERWLGERIILASEHVVRRQWRGSPLLIAGNLAVGLPGYDLLLPAEHAAAAWTSLLASDHLRPIGQDAWEVLRVEAGQPRYGPELNERTLPAEARLEQRAISFTKGCYPGQEIVARIRNRGQVHRFLRGIVLPDGAPPPAGTAILAGERPVGTVTSAAYSPSLGRPIALAFIQREVTPGTTVQLADGRSATVVEPPFLREEAS